jgi:hypothetical protein
MSLVPCITKLLYNYFGFVKLISIKNRKWCGFLSRTSSTYPIIGVEQCFSHWGPRRDVTGSEGRKCIVVEEFYWRYKICTYECKWKISFNYGVFVCYSLKILFSKHGVYNFDFNLIIILIFYFLKCYNAQKSNNTFLNVCKFIFYM